MKELKVFLWADFLNQLRTGKTYISAITKELDITYAYANHTATLLEKHGFLTKEKSGRNVYIELTAVGSEVAKRIQFIQEAIDNGKNTNKKKSKSRKR